jgi:hypothetical protein
MNTMGKTALCAALMLTVVACGPLNENNISTDALNVVREKLGGAPAIVPQAPAPALTRAQVDANPGGYIVLNAYNGSLVTAMAPGGTNGNRITWLSPNGLSTTTQNGILVASRGFPRDLMAADVDGVMLALMASGGSTTRMHEILSDTDQIVTQTFACTVTSRGAETIKILGRQIATERFSEDCKSDRLAFGNSYWIDDGGRIVRSQQAIAPESGYIQLDQP